VLATIASATHSPSARARAFDDLPKRAKSLGSSVVAWIKSLARRCAMGNFVNAEVVNHCLLIAQELFQEGHMDIAMIFLKCVKAIVQVFPTLGGTRDAFSILVEMFGECLSSKSAQPKKSIERSGIVTILSGILAVVAPAHTASYASASNVSALLV